MVIQTMGHYDNRQEVVKVKGGGGGVVEKTFRITLLPPVLG